jgi:hypothetical protein
MLFVCATQFQHVQYMRLRYKHHRQPEQEQNALKGQTNNPEKVR